MKICAACSQALPKEKFSKKQWQSKQCRRCKECIAANREVVALAAPDNELPACADVVDEPCWTDEDLFKQPPPNEECPICMLPNPFRAADKTFQECCGKVLCNGCIYANQVENKRQLCPFCKTPPATSDGEFIEMLKKRVDADNAVAIYTLGGKYSAVSGGRGLPQNYNKAIELWLRAGELGYAPAYYNIGYAYYNGEGVERDDKKAKYYFELGAMGGDVIARHNLGIWEANAGNMKRAAKHWMISAAAGHDDSLKEIRQCFMGGFATKEDFEIALRAHKEAKDEMKSDQREAAAVFFMKFDRRSKLK